MVEIDESKVILRLECTCGNEYSINLPSPNSDFQFICLGCGKYWHFTFNRMESIEEDRGYEIVRDD